MDDHVWHSIDWVACLAYHIHHVKTTGENHDRQNVFENINFSFGSGFYHVTSGLGGG
jgi:hypothetical protein